MVGLGRKKTVQRPRAIAGATALAKYTMSADEAIPTFAMKSRDLMEALGKGEIIGCPGREEAEARMEAWKYDPWTVAKDDPVDACSLDLTLRYSGDERVQKELEARISGFLK
jgi:hypothetical protein